MAVLSEQERFDLWAEFMRTPETGDNYTTEKADLRAMIDAIDDWIDANSTSFNNAIPQPARSAYSARQKARAFVMVLHRRFEVS